MNVFHATKERLVRLGFATFAFLLAVLYDVFFWNESGGIGFLVFVGVYVGIFLTLNAWAGHIRQRWSFWLLIPIAVLSLDVVIYNNDLVHFLVPLATFFLLVVFSLVLPLRNPDKHPFAFSQIPFLQKIDLALFRWSPVAKDVLVWGQGARREVVRQIVVGIFISVPLLFVFGTFFRSADAVFATFVDSFFHFSLPDALGWRIIRTVLLAGWLASFYYVLIEPAHALQKFARVVAKPSSVTLGMVLGLLNVLFLVFVFIQVNYLFGGNSFLASTGVTYAEYARSGFFELVWVIVFAGALVGLTYAFTSHHPRERMVTFLQGLLLLQIAVIASSALKRMYLYEAAYGFTVLRLYVEWFVYLVELIIFVTFFHVVLHWPFRAVAHIALMLGVVAFTLVASVNVDGLIAKRNIVRTITEQKDIDFPYLSSLSVDAAPAIAEFGPTVASTTMPVAQDPSLPVPEPNFRSFWRSVSEQINKRQAVWHQWNYGVSVARKLLSTIPTK